MRDRTFRLGEKRHWLEGGKQVDNKKEEDKKQKLPVGQNDIKDVHDQIEEADNNEDEDKKKKVIKDNAGIAVD